MTSSVDRFATCSQSVALVYDRVNSQGGAERVLEQLHALYPEAPLYTSVYDPDGAPWAHNFDVRTTWLQKFSWARTHHRWFGWLMPLLFWSHDLRQHDVIISVTSEFAKAVRTTSDQHHWCYLLTPTRYLWSHRRESLQTLPMLLQPVAAGVIYLLALLDRALAQRPDKVIAISELVAKRSAQYYKRKVDAVIYPPVEDRLKTQKPSAVPTGKFAVAYGRHVSYKKFDWCIRAAVEQQIPLVIAGNGPQTESLHQLAQTLDSQSKWVTFVGRVSDAELRWYVEHAQAAWFPQVEDFGISLLEAALAGCPVVSPKQSGAVELLDSKCGVFYIDDSWKNFSESVLLAQDKKWSRLDIQRQAKHYAGKHFKQEWKKHATIWM